MGTGPQHVGGGVGAASDALLSLQAALASKPAKASVKFDEFLNEVKLTELDFSVWPQSEFTDYLRDQVALRVIFRRGARLHFVRVSD